MIERNKRVEGVVRDLLLVGETSTLVILQVVRKQVPDTTYFEVVMAKRREAR